MVNSKNNTDSVDNIINDSTDINYVSDAEDNHEIVNLPRMPHPGIYLIPNTFTLAALFSAFYAIVQAMNGNFEYAAMAIFASLVLDGMDGRIARLTNTQSSFGEQFDSLADMVSFGVAPALIMYEWQLKSLGKWGWLAAFIYVAGAAIRLARFNTNIKVIDKRFFQGLPSPASGALLAGFVWLVVDLRVSLQEYRLETVWVAFILTVYAGVSMVSNVPFWSGKSLTLRKSLPVWSLGLVALIFVLISSNPPLVLFGGFVLYGCSGYLISMYRFLKRVFQAKKHAYSKKSP
ncbi:MAG: CDP-diacylglycerol--serine O-phosphatidyltransferase [Pseudomonadota bacterium]|jgi:CDP-diacylglycerol--serine O-phosphatidyltransferase